MKTLSKIMDTTKQKRHYSNKQALKCFHLLQVRYPRYWVWHHPVYHRLLVGWKIELTKLRMEAASQGLDQSIFLESLKAAGKEAESLRQHDSSIPSNRYIDILRASVRPFITYTFFFAFLGIKIAIILVMLREGVTGSEILKVVWDDYTNAIFGAICGFWFGNRAFIHMNTRKQR